MPFSPRLRPIAALAALIGACTSPRLRAPQPDADGHAPRAARVERGLLPGVVVRGRDQPARRIEERMRAYGVPGVSVAVVDSGRVVWARAYGLADVATGRAATTATLFQAASISKPVAATAMLQLVQEGRLALDEDVNRRLRSWTVPTSEPLAGRAVTPRGLVTHTAGLTVHGFRGYAPGEALPTAVQVLAGEPPANSAPVRVDVAPGTTYRYSGGGYTVMQVLLEDLTGAPFAALLRRRVLEPAGMTASTFDQPLPAARAPEAATGYRPDGTPVAGRYHTYPEQAAAGLWTTPTDLARWIVAVQRSLAGAPGALLDRATAEAMVSPGLGDHGLGPGIGGAGDSLRFLHNGANEGFRATLVGFARRGQGAVVMTNGDRGSELANEIVRAIAREYGWPGYAPLEIVPVAVSADALAAYAGGYAAQGASAPVAVAANGRGGVSVTTPTGEVTELVPTGVDEFRALPRAFVVRFERGADGRVTGMTTGRERLARVS